VLELGCGIGTFTFLLSKRVKKGKIEAVDISPESIEYARGRIPNDNITFSAADIVTYIPSLQIFDFILLFDVIEHIPVSRHDELFHNIAAVCKDSTKVLINIPNPDYITYDKENNPEVLQVIDQALPLKLILQNIENNGLDLVHFETHSVWVENDYQFFVVHKKRAFTENRLSDKRNMIQKAITKIKRYYIRMKYDY
jgi:SAM-dependent methyltransferase